MKLSKEERTDLVANLRKKVKALATKVHPFYCDLGWTWLEHPNPPSVRDIENELNRMLDDLLGGSAVEVSCGGLTVGIEPDGAAYMHFSVSEHAYLHE